MENTLKNSFDLIGADNAVSVVLSMKQRGSAARGIVIYGDKGLGKKTLATYIAAMLLCKEPASDGHPCGHCRSCRMILSGGHPDLIRVAPSLKSGGYKLEEDLRAVVSDAAIAPSESDYKVYIIADMDKTPPGSQNALLKLIEEPPAHTAIILTAAAKEYFLPTILSRTLCIAAMPVTDGECKAYLMSHTEGKSEGEINGAIEAMGGNIGMCLEFLSGTTLPKAVGITTAIADAIASKDEYEILKAFWSCDGSRELSLSVLKMLSNLLRDAVLMQLGCCEKRTGCSEKSARALCDSLSGRHLSHLCEIPEKYIGRINGNGNLALCLSSVCADIKSAIG